MIIDFLGLIIIMFYPIIMMGTSFYAFEGTSNLPSMSYLLDGTYPFPDLSIVKKE